jgi:hypothetical protein
LLKSAFDRKEDHRLANVTQIGLALPETTREMMGRHAGFHVG